MTVPSFVDGETNLDAATLNQLVTGINDGATNHTELAQTVTNMNTGIVNVLDYGAVGDGVTDDTAAIQAAITAAGAAGGGIVWFPLTAAGEYLLSEQYSTGQERALVAPYDNLMLWGAPGVTLVTSDAVAHLHVGGYLKGGAETWLDYWVQDPDAFTVYDIDPASRYDMEITLDTAADAAHFAVGDDIFIRTGQLNTISATAQEPDAELNVVTSVDAGTGVLGVKYPLTRPYAAENFPAGSPSAGNPTPLGVVNCTGYVQRNLTIRGLRFRSDHDSPDRCPIIGAQLDGFVVEDCEFDTPSTQSDLNVYRNFRFSNLRCTVRDDDDTYWWFPGTAVATTDGLIENVDLWSASPHTWCHMHNPARVTVRTVRIRVPSSDTLTTFPIMIRSRAYGLLLDGADVVSPGVAGAGIYVGEECTGGGVITNSNVHAVYALSVGAAGWHLGPNLFDGRVALYNNADDGKIDGGTGPVAPETISNWVSWDRQAPEVGTLPAGSRVQSIGIYVSEAFDSDGTDQIAVGRSGGTEAYAAYVDVATTGEKTVTLGAEGAFVSVEQTVIATYTNGGSEPTEGRALVVVTYVRVPLEVTA